MLPEVHVWYIKNSKHLSRECWADCFGLLPDKLRESVNNRYFWKDRQASLLGKLLLEAALKLKTPEKSLYDLRYNNYKKPFVNGLLNFNISHSGDYVVCAFTTLPEAIGIDIEQVRYIEIEDFKDIFTTTEWNHIENATHPESAFFKLWTIKESVIKADGRGLHIPLKSLKINNNQAWQNNNCWYFRPVFIEKKYKCHLVTKTENYKVHLKETTLETLLSFIKPACSVLP